MEGGAHPGAVSLGARDAAASPPRGAGPLQVVAAELGRDGGRVGGLLPDAVLCASVSVFPRRQCGLGQALLWGGDSLRCHIPLLLTPPSEPSTRALAHPSLSLPWAVAGGSYCRMPTKGW